MSLGNRQGAAAEPKRSHRVRTGLLVAGAVIVIAAIVASLVSIPYYAITPGTAQSVAGLIGVPRSKAHNHHGAVLLVDVELTPLRAIEWPYFALNPNAQIIGSSDILGPETPSQYNTEGVLDMQDAQQAATVVALQRLGYHVRALPQGALMYAFIPGSPAEHYLRVGEVITGVDGKAVTTAIALSKVLSRYRPGDTVSMRLLSYPARRAETVRVQLGAWRVKGKGPTATLVCPLYGEKSRYPLLRISPVTGKRRPSVPCIGSFDAETSYRLTNLPFKVDLSNEGIIGPSAGLAFTLGLMQRLDPFDLTGGHKVAATGTMSVTGAVGPVGGVAQKTVAVRDSGAQIFFVPPAEYKVAKAHAGTRLRVYAVSSVDQALRILRSYGGRLPASTPSH